MAEYAAQITQLGDQVAGLTLKQAVDLEDYLRSEYGIEAPAGAVVQTTTDHGKTDQGKTDDTTTTAQTTFDVILKSAGEKKINVIKVVRAITGLGLKEAKELVEGAPKTVKEGLPKEEADKIKAEIEKEGGQVELK